jgi:putative MATE family efflux protein
METTENKMGTMPINKLLLTMSVPMMVSMLVQALYNIVDSIFVAQLSENALTAVSLSFPIQVVMIALGVGTGVGVNAVLSKRLGEKLVNEAVKVANNSVILAVLCYIVFLAVGLFLSNWFFRIQTNDPIIIEYGQRYISICCIFSFGIFGQICFERLLQSTGRTIYTMYTQAAGAIINIILDPILIFGKFGFPEMGIAGAAVATIIGQSIGMLLAIMFNIMVNKEIKLHFKNMKLEWKIVKEIYQVGIPAILMQSIGSIMVFGFNKILIAFTPTATAVFGVYFKLQSFIFMPVFGLNNGMVPIIAYNYGAKNKERITTTIKYSMLYATGIMLIGLLLAQLIPGQLLLLFDASENMLSIGIPALRILSLCYLFVGVNIISSSLYQAVGNSMYSLITAVARQLLVVLPVAYLLSLAGQLNLIWLSFPIAELVATLICIIFTKKTMNKLQYLMTES